MPSPQALKVALVTGASSGIGRAVAIRFAESGFRVFGTARRGIAARLTSDVALLELDVRDDASVAAAVEHVHREAGRIDVLVNNAGYALEGAIEETSDAEFSGLFETNVFGVARMIRATLPIMRAQGSGRIINLGSILGLLPAPFLGFYSASKHALEGLSESLDHEVRSFGVRIVLIEPGYTRTELARSRTTAATELPDYLAMRRRVSDAFAEHTVNGIDPKLVADAIFNAATALRPRLRYAVGPQAITLALLRRLGPTGLLDRGVRRNLRMDTP